MIHKKLRKAILVMDNSCCCNLLLGLALSDIGGGKSGMSHDLAEYFSNSQHEGRVYRFDGKESPAPAACSGGTPCSFCGALAAAIAVLYCAKENEDAANCQDELMDWFGEHFGSFDCDTIASMLKIPRDELCPKVILETYLRLRDYIDPDNHLSQKTLI
ncbi:MAG: C-GCAxxG-C-C family protein [Clostridiales Family XIII bacterium]|jgi:hypothetical protein|nr:C-GCAxxG-C-C family protein [Clostridiales Family XIII bacterium]